MDLTVNYLNRILVILPTIFTAEGEDLVRSNKEVCSKLARPNTRIDVINISKGPASVESSYDKILAGYYIIDHAQEAEKEGYDAIVISCFADPALEACREVTSIPVVSAGLSSYLLAAGLFDRFGVVTPSMSALTRNMRTIRVLGLESKVAAVEVAQIPVLEMGDSKKLKNALLGAAKKTLIKGANAIILGCTGMAGMADEMSHNLNVPVIDPLVTALKFAENLIELGLVHSKNTYKTPKLTWRCS